MRESDTTQFHLVIRALAATFRTEATDALFYGYWIGLEDLDLRAVQQGAARAMRECRFMPCVAELRSFAGVQTPAQRAAIAWAAVTATLARHDYYDTVNFDDPAVNASIRCMGGWEELSLRWERDKEEWIRKDFERTYQTYCQRGMTVSEGAPLLGYFDRTNLANGFKAQSPVLIQTTLTPTPRLTGPEPMQPLALEYAESIGTMEPKGPTP
jgi:hypothetical protein